jgi:hypothetical protein
MMEEADAMTIQITKPEVEALINQRESTSSDRRVQGRRGRCVAGPSVFAPTSGSNPAKKRATRKEPG